MKAKYHFSYVQKDGRGIKVQNKPNDWCQKVFFAIAGRAVLNLTEKWMNLSII